MKQRDTKAMGKRKEESERGERKIKKYKKERKRDCWNNSSL